MLKFHRIIALALLLLLGLPLATRLPLETRLQLLADEPLDTPAGGKKEVQFVLLEEERSRILDLFQATGEKISPNGTLELIYDFTSKNEILGEDWSPIPTNPFGRIGQPVRWTRGGEGGVVGVAGGIYMADKGQWFHRAVWKPQVKVESTFYSFCGGSVGDMVAATYGWTKGLRRRVGSNLGSQVMRISGVKPAGGIGKPSEIIFREPVNFGFELKDGQFSAQRGGRTQQQSSSSKFLKKLDSGQVGFVWNGNIRCCITKVTLRGQLDLDWAAKSIPDLKTRLKEHRATKGSR
jgi:hypothetical protein